MADMPVDGKIFKIVFEYMASGISIIPRAFKQWRVGRDAMVLDKLPVPGSPTNLD